jgi:hypothetical protein
MRGRDATDYGNGGGWDYRLDGSAAAEASNNELAGAIRECSTSAPTLARMMHGTAIAQPSYLGLPSSFSSADRLRRACTALGTIRLPHQAYWQSRKRADSVLHHKVSVRVSVNAKGTSMKGSMLTRVLFAIVFLSLTSQPSPLRASPLSLPGGSYELTARLELPHLERWGVDKTTTICLSNFRGPDEIPVPVVSANNPFAKCSAANLIADGSKLEYDIVCPERGSARGHAVYKILPDGFSGRIAMVMGAKNMTMSEVQHGRRVGECSPAKMGSASQF